MVSEDDVGIWVEADMYFIDDSGEYQFNPLKLEEAHRWCRNETMKFLIQENHLVVSNTFVHIWEMGEYITMAINDQIPLQIIECKGSFESEHHVPPGTILLMQRDWEQVPMCDIRTKAGSQAFKDAIAMSDVMRKSRKK